MNKGKSRKLALIKLVHTLVWCVLVAAILYVCYAGAFNQISGLVWYCVGLVILEGLALLLNRGKCPLTSLASQYTSDHSAGFDIYLPRRLAKYNKLLFSSLFLAGLSLVIWRVASPAF